MALSLALAPALACRDDGRPAPHEPAHTAVLDRHDSPDTAAVDEDGDPFEWILPALPIILALMFFAIHQARRKRWSRHKAIQISITAALTVLILALEYELQFMDDGGAMATERARRFENGWVRAALYAHLALSAVTAIILFGLIGTGLWKFGSPPRPGPFSARHRFWGWLGAAGMTLTAITGLVVYVLCYYLVDR